MEQSLIIFFAILIVMSCGDIGSGQVKDDPGKWSSVDGVQRLDAYYIVQPSSWINKWTTKSIPKLKISHYAIVFAVAVTKPESLQWFVIAENRPTRKEIGDPLPVVVDFTLFFGIEEKGKTRVKNLKIDGDSVEPLLSVGWELAEDPPREAQDINQVIGFNEEWLLLCREWKEGQGISSLHSCYGLNPPKGGKLPTIWKKLRSLVPEK